MSAPLTPALAGMVQELEAQRTMMATRAAQFAGEIAQLRERLTEVTAERDSLREQLGGLDGPDEG